MGPGGGKILPVFGRRLPPPGRGVAQQAARIGGEAMLARFLLNLVGVMAGKPRSQGEQRPVRQMFYMAAIIGAAIMMPAADAVAAGAPLHSVDDLAARVSHFAGRPARIDPRLILPFCPAPQLAPAGGGAVAVHCAAPAWDIFVALDGPAPAAPAIAAAPLVKRGDRVVVEAGGPGFAVSMEAVAERDAADGRVWVKSATGKRLVAQMDGEGRVRLPKAAW